jgi:hypothetical protein
MPPSERPAYLCELRARNTFLHREVEALLASDGEPRTTLDIPAVGAQFRLRTLSLSYTSVHRQA